ncbi:MAG: hypothetical protein Q7V88_08495 [Actinomycetota bacterium]|nr:hypothetical protein [Actinomycetota bacterium]
MSRPLSILTVCSYNRVRSVMAQLLLQRALDAAGVRATVQGAGFAEPGKPPLPDTVRVLRQLGLDAAAVLTTRVDDAMVAGADLVLTAERLHVVRLAEDRHDVFAKAYTLPEFAARAEAAGQRGRRTMHEWLAAVGQGRTHAGFLSPATPEIADPAGLSTDAFGATAIDIDGWCRAIARLL